MMQKITMLFQREMREDQWQAIWSQLVQREPEAREGIFRQKLLHTTDEVR